MTLDDLHFLLTPTGQQLLQEIGTNPITPHNHLNLVMQLRQQVPAPQAQAILETALLRQLAAAKFSPPDPQRWIQDKLDEDKDIGAMARAQMTGYLVFARDDLDAWEILDVETQVARAIHDPTDPVQPLTDTVNIKGEPVQRFWVYGGKIDMRARYKADGKIYHWEHKNTSASDLEKFCRKLDFDPQTRGYAWAAMKPLDGAAETGEPYTAAGLVYNVLQKKTPSVPALKQDGTTSKRKIDTTKEIFTQTLIERGEDPDDFADLVDGLKSAGDYFKRVIHPFSEDELREFGDEIAWDALRMMEESHKPYHPRQTQVCTGPAAYRCEYRDICVHDTPDGRAPFSIKNIRHEELTGILAEPDCGVERGLHAGPDDRPIDDGGLFVDDDLIF